MVLTRRIRPPGHREGLAKDMKLKWIIGVVLFILVSVILLPRFFHNRDLPEELNGVWETSSEKYADRYFLLDKNAVGFDTGDGNVEWYEITHVTETREKNTKLYTIEFQQVGGTLFRRLLFFDPSNGGKIRFKNQPGIEWVHAPE
jgi:hypothetical protein